MSEQDPWKGWYAGQPEDKTISAPPPGGATFKPRAGGTPGASPSRGAWPVQPPAHSPSGYSPPGYPPPGAPPATPWQPAGPGIPRTPGSPGAPVHRGRRWRFWGRPGRRGRRIVLIIVIVIVLLLAALGGTYFWINGKVNRSVTLPASSVTSAGTNWLIAGSDARTGISRTERAKLHLGSDGADASDSLMLLHMGTGQPVLISIPRDSYVPIPGHGSNKINAALAFGGPSLLAQTVEEVTGLHVDHYMSIGFGGLANVVNTVGGVRICVTKAIKADPYSGFKGMAAGCHELSGPQAIAFVRDRHSFATSDLQRIQDQRAFMAALLSKATSPGVYLNPFTSLPFASTAASSIAVDKGTSLYDLMQAAFALRSPQSGTVPIANANYQTAAGDAVKWDTPKARSLFDALKAGKPVPKGLLSGTKVG